MGYLCVCVCGKDEASGGVVCVCMCVRESDTSMCGECDGT